MTPEQAAKRIAELEQRLLHVQLEYSIHHSAERTTSIAELAEYLNCEFDSDILIMAVINAIPNPRMRHTSPSAPIDSPELRDAQRQAVYYPIEFMDYTDYLCDTIFEPRIHVITFRADKGIGLLLNPNAQHVLTDQYAAGCPELLLDLLQLMLREMDVRFGFRNTCSISAPHKEIINLYEMYREVRHAADYSWNLTGNLHTYQELETSPLSPEDQVRIIHLEREFSSSVEQLLFFESAAILDRILDLELTHSFPVGDVIRSTTARLRNVVAVAEALTDVTVEDLKAIDQLVYAAACSASIPEFRDRVHDFFANMSDFGPRQSQKKGAMILEFIESNYKNPLLGAQMICDRFRISQTYLSRLIRQETEHGLVDCIQRYRVDSAKQLLEETQLGIEPIALQVGFSNRYGLVRAFRKLEGTTPDAWRREHAELPRTPEQPATSGNPQYLQTSTNDSGFQNKPSAD